MATYRKHKTAGGDVRWTATIRKQGWLLTRTWGARREAEGWARDTEAAIARATPAAPFVAADWLAQRAPVLATPEPDRPHIGWTLGQAFERYEAEETPKKKGAAQERVRVAAWKRHALAAKALADVAPADVQRHVDARLAAGRGPATVRLECYLLSALYRHAASPVGGWGLALTNPVPLCRIPSQPDPRDRCLLVGEESRLLEALRKGAGGTDMADIAAAAIHTGLRQSELLDLRAGQVRQDTVGWVVRRPDSKNGRPRAVYLDAVARDVLCRRAAGLTADERVFAALKPDTVEKRWTAACRRAGIQGLRFHDLRHEAISRWMDAGMSVAEIAAQSGQRSAQVLLGYAKARPSAIAAKLGGRGGAESNSA